MPKPKKSNKKTTKKEKKAKRGKTKKWSLNYKKIFKLN